MNEERERKDLLPLISHNNVDMERGVRGFLYEVTFLPRRLNQRLRPFKDSRHYYSTTPSEGTPPTSPQWSHGRRRGGARPSETP